MTDYFAEKQHQVDPCSFNAFGVKIWSRYGKAFEIIEMLNFVKSAATDEVVDHVKEVFYDSKACICSITLSSGLTQYDPKTILLKEAALKSISQFEWFNTVEHGDPMEDQYGIEGPE